MSSGGKPTLSIIIPVLNEACSIGATLDSVARLPGSIEVLVVDGGSADETCEIARARGARVIRSERGRGVQLHAGARAASGDVLWFLHADTIAPRDSIESILDALSDPAVAGGNFDVRFSGAGHAANFMTWFYPQLRRLGLCYGDSAIFVRREAYDRTGGFKAVPIFEDLDLLRELKRIAKFVHLSATVVTSSRRFEKHSFVVIFTGWVAMQLLYWVGVNPKRLGRLYAPSRTSFRKHS